MSLVRFKSISPILPVKEIARALDHYGSLGFAVNSYEGGEQYGSPIATRSDCISSRSRIMITRTAAPTSTRHTLR